jgi:hypothetical protein
MTANEKKKKKKNDEEEVIKKIFSLLFTELIRSHTVLHP